MGQKTSKISKKNFAQNHFFERPEWEKVVFGRFWAVLGPVRAPDGGLLGQKWAAPGRARAGCRGGLGPGRAGAGRAAKELSSIQTLVTAWRRICRWNISDRWGVGLRVATNRRLPRIPWKRHVTCKSCEGKHANTTQARKQTGGRKKKEGSRLSLVPLHKS